jgi:hypothetical protein
VELTIVTAFIEGREENHGMSKERIQELREKAKRARRLADSVTSETVTAHLTRYAFELEIEAAEIEATLPDDPSP